jgi:general secretion pathway protein G
MPSSTQGRRGFTFIELLAVTAIIGVLAAIAIPALRGTIERAKVAHAIGDIEAIQAELDALDSLPADLDVVGRAGMLDPWGRPYQYLLFPPNQPPPPGARLDRFTVPLNTRYDLYSVGPDGQTAAPLTAGVSVDDVVRAGDGAYIGPASRY